MFPVNLDRAANKSNKQKVDYFSNWIWSVSYPRLLQTFILLLFFRAETQTGLLTKKHKNIERKNRPTEIKHLILREQSENNQKR